MIRFLMTQSELDKLESTLVQGIRDFMKKNGFTRAHLGLSGGIDSALTAYLAVQAAGAENVTGISLPSRFSSQGSKDDAAKLAANLHCRYETIPIEGIYSAFLTSLEKVFENRPFDVAEENLQARIRGTLLMTYANKFNSVLLATGNKSEASMGYCTLYGDTCGAIEVIGNLFKTDVYELANRINAKTTAAGNGKIIPQEIIDKSPSAELHPGQKDEDSLPPYDTLDAILRLYLNEKLSPAEISAKGWDSKLVNHIINTTDRMEFKRIQCPPSLPI